MLLIEKSLEPTQTISYFVLNKKSTQKAEGISNQNCQVADETGQYRVAGLYDSMLGETAGCVPPTGTPVDAVPFVTAGAAERVRFIHRKAQTHMRAIILMRECLEHP